jgi:hypothetical protein
MFCSNGEGDVADGLLPTSNRIVAVSVLTRYDTPKPLCRPAWAAAPSYNGKISSVAVSPMLSGASFSSVFASRRTSAEASCRRVATTRAKSANPTRGVRVIHLRDFFMSEFLLPERVTPDYLDRYGLH